MSSEGSSAPAERPRAQKMALQNVNNAIVCGLLSTPGIASGIGKRLITLYVVGRKSGKHYSVPVAYTSHGEKIIVGSPFGWGKNLRTGEPLEVRYKGKRRTADVEVVKDEAGVVALYDVICRDNRQFARFNKVRLDKAGTPDPGDLRGAWEQGARVFKLTLR
jgi:deazaflavin-dependent oxidoreductase (nitroreductase family)